jgi:hypothetical protein
MERLPGGVDGWNSEVETTDHRVVLIVLHFPMLNAHPICFANSIQDLGSDRDTNISLGDFASVGRAGKALAVLFYFGIRPAPAAT